MLSTKISVGRSFTSSASYSATTAPVSCIRSKLRQTRTCSNKPLPRRLAKAEQSDPNRATSNPHTSGAKSLILTSRVLAPSSSSMGMIVSSSLRGNSPSTRIRNALLSSP